MAGRSVAGFGVVIPWIITCCAVVIVLFGTKFQATEAGDSPDKVKVTVYYESLCWNSRQFIKHQLHPTLQDLRDIMIIELYAYGKTREGKDHSFTCQHGLKECQGNIMLTCAKVYVEDFEKLLSFTNCVMDAFVGLETGRSCAGDVGVDFAPIETCSAGNEGLRLLHDVGVKQSELHPSLNHVPWILINDEYGHETQLESEAHLRKVVCRTYQGPKPAACL